MSEKVLVNLWEDMQTTMDFVSILLDVLRSRGQERFKIKPKQKDALQKIVLDSQDCLMVPPTGYGKSLIYQLTFTILIVSLRKVLRTKRFSSL